MVDEEGDVHHINDVRKKGTDRDRAIVGRNWKELVVAGVNRQLTVGGILQYKGW